MGRRRRPGVVVGITGLLVLVALLGIRNAARRAPVPSVLGVQDGKLAPCPPTPNCVSTQTEDARHQAEPLVYSGSREAAKARLLAALRRMGQNQVAADTTEYVHAEFRIRGMGFVDDVEFYLPPGEPAIHFRSASRLGRSDLGVNRRRMEALRAIFESLKPVS